MLLLSYTKDSYETSERASSKIFDYLRLLFAFWDYSPPALKLKDIALPPSLRPIAKGSPPSSIPPPTPRYYSNSLSFCV